MAFRVLLRGCSHFRLLQHRSLASSLEISTGIPIFRKSKMSNREYDLEIVRVNFKIPSFDFCALLLCVCEKELLQGISRASRSIYQHSYKTMSFLSCPISTQPQPRLPWQLYHRQDRTWLRSPWTCQRILSSLGTNRKSVTANSFTYRPRAKAVVY